MFCAKSICLFTMFRCSEFWVHCSFLVTCPFYLIHFVFMPNYTVYVMKLYFYSKTEYAMPKSRFLFDFLWWVYTIWWKQKIRLTRLFFVHKAIILFQFSDCLSLILNKYFTTSFSFLWNYIEVIKKTNLAFW